MTAARAAGLLVGVAADTVLIGPRRHLWTGGRLAAAVEHAGGDRVLVSGVPFGLALGAAVLGGLGAELLGRRNPLLQAAGTAVATWAVLGGASVVVEGAAMARALDAGDIAQARRRLPLLSRCDPAALDTAGLARAAVESVARSTANAMVGPLLWGAVAGMPGLLGYRVVNTLESVTSGRNRRLDRTAAALDDMVNLVPSRAAAVLTALCAPVVGGSAAGAWQVWRRDRALHPHPNDGQVTAAFAGALEIRLGGRTPYPHGVAERPVLGHGRTPDAGDVTRGVELSRVVGVAAAASSAMLALLVGGRGRRRGNRHRVRLRIRLRVRLRIRHCRRR